MVFGKSFPRTSDKSTYPIWEEVFLTEAEEKEEERKAKEENIKLMKECIEDAKALVKEKDMKGFETNIVNIAIALFEKRGSHQVFWKESKCKEKFDAKK